MVTTPQLLANRSNALVSTGPRTPDGKAVAAQNATRHGCFAAVPVIANLGETQADWDAHRAGVVDSLAPVGLLEVTLAERVALLMWRLGRVARYEVAHTAVAVEDVELPSMPNPPGLLGQFTSEHRFTLADHIEKRAKEQRKTAAAARKFDEGFAVLDAPDATVVGWRPALVVLTAAFDEAESRREGAAEHPADSSVVLKRVGIVKGDCRSATWTAGMVRAALVYYAECAELTTEQVIPTVRARVASARDGVLADAAAIATEIAGLRTRQARSKEWKKVGLMLPNETVEGKITRYEAHLARQFQQTLTQLERLQAVRAGTPVLPPLAVEVGVNVATDAR